MSNQIGSVITLIKAEQDKIKNALAKGTCHNFETYHRLVGSYDGLNLALQMIDETLRDCDEHTPMKTVFKFD